MLQDRELPRVEQTDNWLGVNHEPKWIRTPPGKVKVVQNVFHQQYDRYRTVASVVLEFPKKLHALRGPRRPFSEGILGRIRSGLEPFRGYFWSFFKLLALRGTRRPFSEVVFRCSGARWLGVRRLRRFGVKCLGDLGSLGAVGSSAWASLGSSGAKLGNQISQEICEKLDA